MSYAGPEKVERPPDSYIALVYRHSLHYDIVQLYGHQVTSKATTALVSASSLAKECPLFVLNRLAMAFRQQAGAGYRPGGLAR